MDFAVRTCERAGEVTLEHFGSAAVERKGDGSEVTAADLASEALIRASLRESFPEDGIIGEEEAAAEGRSGRRWIVDPIDGTRSFAAGVPLYGILLALEERGAPVLGCCHFPALRQTLVAALGAGAWIDGKPARVSGVERLSEARLVTSGLEYWRDWGSEEGREGFGRLVSATRYARTWGDCYGYAMVATGRADLMVEVAVGSHWDYAALLPIMAEAGGRFTTLGGGPVGTFTSGLASNGRLHDDAISFWDAASRGDAAVQVESVLARHSHP